MRADRIHEIEKYIHENNFASIKELCEIFNVSINTIRRDLAVLVGSGNVKKVYGGVESIHRDPLIPFSERSPRFPEEKERIAQKAAEYVQDGDIIYLDSGTTTAPMIDYIHTRQNVTVLTNNLSVVMKGQRYPNLYIIVLPGVLTHRTFSTTGPETLAALNNYNITKAFMAATGATIEAGFTNTTSAEYEIKKAVLQKSEKSFMLMDCSKWDKVSLLTFSPLDGIDHLITDRPLASNYREFFASHGIDISIA